MAESFGSVQGLGWVNRGRSLVRAAARRDRFDRHDRHDELGYSKVPSLVKFCGRLAISKTALASAPTNIGGGATLISWSTASTYFRGINIVSVYTGVSKLTIERLFACKRCIWTTAAIWGSPQSFCCYRSGTRK